MLCTAYFQSANAILSQLPDKDTMYPIHLPRLHLPPSPPFHHHRRHDHHQQYQHQMTHGHRHHIFITASIIFSIIEVAKIGTLKSRLATLTSISGTLLLN